MKFRWIRYIAERLPKEIRERRKTEIEACFTGTKKQLEEKVMESLYEQVKIVVVATAIFLMILLLTIVMYLSQDRRILITRDETGGETTEEQIRIKTKKDDDIYSLTIRPKGYTKSQITDALDRGEKYLKEHLVAKNKSINEVSIHLEMPSKISAQVYTGSPDPGALFGVVQGQNTGSKLGGQVDEILLLQLGAAALGQITVQKALAVHDASFSSLVPA